MLSPLSAGPASGQVIPKPLLKVLDFSKEAHDALHWSAKLHVQTIYLSRRRFVVAVDGRERRFAFSAMKRTLS